MENKYPITLYLNQKYVFDILAIMEDGFSQLENIKSTVSSEESKERRMGGEIGTSNIFGFLGIKIGARGKKGTSDSDKIESLKEKVHTPNSLFAKMRERIYEDNLIKSIEDCKVGDFVEIKAELNRNPLISALEGILSIMEIAIIFDPSYNLSKNVKTNQSNPNKLILNQIQNLIEQINKNNTIDVIGKTVNESNNIVLNLDRNYLSDPTLNDLEAAEFTIFGKATKIINEDSEEKINLLRKTKLSSIQGKVLEQIKDSFKGLDEQGIHIPELQTEINGPVVQIIPIGIFS